MSYTATRALQTFLSSKSLNSLFLRICEFMQDFLIAAVCEDLASQTFLKSLDLRLDGELISFGANFLEKCLIENSSSNHLRV